MVVPFPPFRALLLCPSGSRVHTLIPRLRIRHRIAKPFAQFSRTIARPFSILPYDMTRFFQESISVVLLSLAVNFAAECPLFCVAG